MLEFGRWASPTFGLRLRTVPVPLALLLALLAACRLQISGFLRLHDHRSQLPSVNLSVYPSLQLVLFLRRTALSHTAAAITLFSRNLKYFHHHGKIHWMADVLWGGQCVHTCMGGMVSVYKWGRVIGCDWQCSWKNKFPSVIL